MSLNRFVAQQIVWGFCIGSGGFFLLILACFYLPVGPNHFFWLLSSALLLLSIFTIWPSFQWINAVHMRHKVGYRVVIIPVPGQTKVEIDLAGIKRGSLIVFFNNVGPEMVAGNISLFVPPEAQEPRVALKLEQPKSCAGFGAKEQYWPRTTGKTFFPLKTSFACPNSDGLSSELRFNLSWNFEGTYLQTLIPESRQIKAEIFVLREEDAKTVVQAATSN